MALPSLVTSTALVASKRRSKQNEKEKNFAVAIVTWEETKLFESNCNELLFCLYREIMDLVVVFCLSYPSHFSTECFCAVN